MLLQQYNFMVKICLDMHDENSGELPDEAHHGGPCIPGVRRTFVNVQGNIYPCEKVSEASRVTCLGNIYDGFDISRVERVLNIERTTERFCHDCWAYRHCSICIDCADDTFQVSEQVTRKNCRTVCYEMESTFLDYCALRELGVDLTDEQEVELFS